MMNKIQAVAEDAEGAAEEAAAIEVVVMTEAAAEVAEAVTEIRSNNPQPPPKISKVRNPWQTSSTRRKNFLPS